jgi:complement component 1 Q subcomponent-binding protein
VAYPDEIIIDNLSVKNPDVSDDQIPYEGPDFQYVLLSDLLFCL